VLPRSDLSFDLGLAFEPTHDQCVADVGRAPDTGQSLLSCLPRRAVEIDVLNELGDDRWELVNITPTGVAYLKRPVVAPALAK
jgi:hypothetical protein